MSVTVRFQEVRLSAEKRMKCDGCGKRVVRKVSRSQTINPFNRCKDGAVKDAADIRAELRVELDRWRAIPVVCKACASEGRLWRVEYLAGVYSVRLTDNYHGYMGAAMPTDDPNRQLAFVTAHTEEEAKKYAANLFFGGAS